MTNNERRQKIQDKLEAHLESPLPLLSRLKNLVFGKENPDTYTQISFYIGLVIWLIFLVWNILGHTVLANTAWIEAEKGLQVQKMIFDRGLALGFEGEEFHHTLVQFYSIALFCWAGIFIGLVLQWRKNLAFIYFIGCSAGIYLLAMLFMLSFSYWYNDTTTFDKISFFLLVGHSFLYYYFLKREKNGDKMNFFGIEDDEN